LLVRFRIKSVALTGAAAISDVDAEVTGPRTISSGRGDTRTGSLKVGRVLTTVNACGVRGGDDEAAEMLEGGAIVGESSKRVLLLIGMTCPPSRRTRHLFQQE
jgi:hypothetical protein